MNNNLMIIKKGLESNNSMIIASFFGLIASISKKDLIKQPVAAIFNSIIGSSIIGILLNIFTPIQLRPYASVGICGLSMCNLIYKIFNIGNINNDDNDDIEPEHKFVINPLSSFITINYTSTNTKTKFDKIFENSELLQRVSHTTHIKLDDGVYTICLIKKLTKNDIISTLYSHENTIDKIVMKNIDLIHDVIRLINTSEINGIFIHDNIKGYVMIRTCDVDNDIIKSINIDNRINH